MNRAQFRMHRLIELFEENRGKQTIGEYFQVPIKITLDTRDLLNLYCIFESPIEYYKLEIPFELNCLILSYLYENKKAIFHIKIPNDYPFRPPEWILIYCTSNIRSQYKTAVQFQNARYKQSWETSINLEKDILYMIDAINQ